jgi:hypothetical protein
MTIGQCSHCFFFLHRCPSLFPIYGTMFIDGFSSVLYFYSGIACHVLSLSVNPMFMYISNILQPINCQIIKRCIAEEYNWIFLLIFIINFHDFILLYHHNYYSNNVLISTTISPTSTSTIIFLFISLCSNS